MPTAPDVVPHSIIFRWVILPLARVMAAVLLFFLGPVRVIGKRRVPKTGGLLILSNHIADVDPVLVQYGCSRPIHFMAKSELFEMGVLGKVIRIFQAFPVKRGEPDRAAIKLAVSLLKQGEAVCVFPEGQLSEDGRLQELKPGVSLLARLSGAEVICCGISGSNKMLPYGQVIPRPAVSVVEIKWGEHRTSSKEEEPEQFLAWVERELRQLTDQ